MEKDLITELNSDLEKVSNPDDLKRIYDKYLGKEGLIKSELKKLKGLSPEERRIKGPQIQSLQAKAQELFDKAQQDTMQKKTEKTLEEQRESLDESVPKVGHLHPITQTVRMLNRVFESMGYSVMEGPEIETDEYCFKRLNVPENHPARDMQDTIYIQEPNILLRTQASSVEARILESYKPPFKVVVPGRVYRNEKVNKSNHFIFHHYQGVVVLERTNLKDLFGTFTHLFKQMYGEDVIVRFRNKYYPEVEPGVGLDMQCFNCKGQGCALCKNIGWIEMGGAGMVHPKALEMAGIDRSKWMAFAFALGLDRWVMARYEITDIRTLLGGNLAYKTDKNENTL